MINNKNNIKTMGPPEKKINFQSIKYGSIKFYIVNKSNDFWLFFGNFLR